MPILNIFSTIGLIIGSVTLLIIALKALRFWALYFRLPAVPLQNYKPASSTVSNGKEKSIAWAVISGSSGGIGFGYSQYLLSLGFGVIIFAETAVAEAEARLRKAHPNGHIKSFTFNCMTASKTDIEKLVDSIKDLPITILINNVGSAPMEMPVWRPFRDYYYEAVEDHWKLNASFMSHFTRHLIPLLSQNAKALGTRSLVLNVTSGGRLGLPLMVAYGSTKGYVTTFSHTLTREFKIFKEPIDCLLIVPGDVQSTGNTKGMQPNSPLANDYAKIVLDRVDNAIEAGHLEISPYWKHALQIAALEWLPENITREEIWKVMVLKRDAWQKGE